MIKPVKASSQGFAGGGNTRLPAVHVAPAASPAVAGFRPAGVALAVAAAFMGVGAAFGQPTGAQAIQGQAFLQQQGTSLLVTTQNAAGTNRSVINWQSFSVPSGSVTRFLQPTAQSLSINRVVGNDPSAIYGTLSSNGRLVLVNPAGIAVGAGAVVDTAGFTASTLKMSEADALAGRLVFGDGVAGGAGVQVDGRILARSGDIVLIAPNVQTGPQALLQAPNGATLLAAGQKVELTGRGLEGIVMEVQAPGNEAVNLGTLQGDAVGVFAGTLKHSGLVQANAVSTEGGKVVLRAAGDNLVDGRIEAKAGDKGGSVDLLGHNVALYGGGSIDASGAHGGGSVRIGGDYQGSNASVPNARSTFIGAGSTINADATQSGDGGRVIIWSDEATRFYGQASARGGESGGNGGFAEVSGKNYLAYAGKVDLRAPHGTTGQLLLDPNDIEIDSNPTDTTQQGPDFSGGTGTSHVNVSDLQGQLATSDVQISTTSGTSGPLGGTITLNSALSWGTSRELTLDADNNIVLNAPITAANGTLGLWANNSITQSGSAPITVATLGVGAGNAVTLNAANHISKFAATGGSGSGDLSLTNAGPLTIDWYDSLFWADGVDWNGAVTINTTGSGSLLTLNSSVVANGGNKALTINSAGGIAMTSGNAGTDGGDVTLTASGGNIDLGNSVVYSNGGSISIGAAAGSITGNGQVSSQKNSGSGNAGDITLSASSGVSVDSVDASAYSYGARGGNISISAGSGGVSIGNIYSNGADNDSVDGGHGGNVDITSAGPVAITGSIEASGGSGAGSGNDGGDVTVTATGSSGSIDIGSEVRADGGTGNSGRGGTGGTIKLKASRALTLEDWVTSKGGDGDSGPGGDGGKISLSAGSAGMTFTTLDASGGLSNSGTGGGTGTVDISTGGAASGSTVNATGGEGSSLGGSGGSVSISSGSLTLTDGVYTNGGDSSLGSGGGAGGVTIATSGAISVGAVGAYGGRGYSGSGGDGHDVTISAGSGAINVSVIATTGGEGDAGNGGDGKGITLTTSGAVTATAIASYGGTGYGGTGGHGGDISLTTGKLQAQNVVSFGGDGDNGGNAGTITIGSKDLTSNLIGAMGGNGSLGNGGDGGAITVTAIGTVTVGNIYSYGTYGAAGRGGDGKDISVTSTNGLVVGSTIDSSGGGGAAGIGGQGGNLTLAAGAGNLSVGTVYTHGGSSDVDVGGPAGNVDATTTGGIAISSVYAWGGSSSSAGKGGDGGNVTLSGGTWAYSPYVVTDGGHGGDNPGGMSWAGGDAGNIGITQTSGAFTLNPMLSATGGNPGWTGDTIAPGGSGGNITLRATNGTLTLTSGSLGAGSSNLGPLGTITATGTGNGGVTITGDVYFQGNWNNTGTMNIGSSAGLDGGGLFTNTGRVLMTGDSYLYSMGGVVNNSGATLSASGGTMTVDLTQNHGMLVVANDATLATNQFGFNDGTIRLSGTLQVSSPCSSLCGGGMLVNDSAGVIAGTGTLDLGGAGVGFLDNYGRLQPGAATQAHGVGTLNINGDVTLEPGSVLAVDIGTTSSYDKLNVTGFTSFGAPLLDAVQSPSVRVATTPVIEVSYTNNVSFSTGAQFSVIKSDGGVDTTNTPTVTGASELKVQAPAPGATTLKLVAQSPVPATPPPTQPPATEPPATQPPATEPPATQPPATQPPATEPPATSPPATQPPATQPPATQPPATQPPATQPPATQPPATQPPATQPPATQPPATQPPATSPPATQPPPPPPPPAPPPLSPLVEKLVELLEGDHDTAQQVVAQLDTNPLTVFTNHLLLEEQKQAEDAKKNNGQPGTDNIVANTCSK